MIRAGTDDHALSAELAEQAGWLLLRVQADHVELDGKAIGALGDQESNSYLIDQLRRWRPDDAILSEESADDPRRLAAVLQAHLADGPAQIEALGLRAGNAGA